MVADIINGCFETLSSALLWMNVATLHRDKETKGVSIIPLTFFFSWGVWNSVYYYPHLGQWASFAGGVSLMLANGVWLGQMVFYRRKNVLIKKVSRPPSSMSNHVIPLS